MLPVRCAKVAVINSIPTQLETIRIGMALDLGPKHQAFPACHYDVSYATVATADPVLLLQAQVVAVLLLQLAPGAKDPVLINMSTDIILPYHNIRNFYM